jgi:hypothetical protein
MRCAFADDLSFALPWQIKPYRHPGEWPQKKENCMLLTEKQFDVLVR